MPVTQETSPKITMSGRFRLFPLTTDYGARGEDDKESRHAKEDLQLSYALSDTPSAQDEGRGSHDGVAPDPRTPKERYTVSLASTDVNSSQSSIQSYEDDDDSTVPPPGMVFSNAECKLTPEPADTDFRKEFPPDPIIGSELEEAARVWKVYRKEAKAFDDVLLDGWSTTLDILLIFAGLFSAVATAFVIESYQSLQPDNTAYAATALYILVAASNHSTGMTLPSPPDLAYKSPLSRWINGLWFTSILLSLAVALLSILAKQWITEYRARNNASAKSPKDWVLRREVYFQALNTWHVAEVVAFLPVLLHLSLFLFFAGVVAFLWTLDKAIGIWIIALGGSLGVFYLACTLIPLWVPQCPTSTPLSMQMRTSALALGLTGLTVILAAPQTIKQTISSVLWKIQRRSPQWEISLVPSRTTVFRNACKRVISYIADRVAGLFGRIHTSNTADTFVGTLLAPAYEPSPTGDNPSIFQRLKKTVERLEGIRDDKSGIRHHLEQNCHKLEADALHWLIVEVSDSDAVAVGLQALGAFRWNSAAVDILRTRDRLVDFPDGIAFTRSSSGHTSSEVLRVIRSAMCMRRHGERVALYERVESLTQGNDADYADLGLLCARTKYLALNIATWREASPSLASTALLAIRAEYLDHRLAYLLCCDLAMFSGDDWDLALKAAMSSGGNQWDLAAEEARANVAVNLIPLFAKPFRLAVLTAARDSRWANVVEDPWVDPLLRRILECLRPSENTPDTYNLLPPSALDLLSERRFYDAIPTESIPAILSYFPYNVDRAMRGATAESLVQFWAAFAFLASRRKTSDTPTSVDLSLVSMCATALRTWRELKAFRSAILDAILRRHVASSATAPFWAIPERWLLHASSTFLEVADALAAASSPPCQ
ncbi:hypothetical protein EXIGLDRAFT_780661 [Exidia glandulosa HHB12029]|uniref:DUF6535 domain-containing protein n=1 Tax=Exidia glandulosa HHB12029 TaxID=1314781 RepID=A0A165BHR4_EXIGL|nr:hypothetical protein EXIGLDRAFT_780661 [Exidia glandulosa HHB12029]